MSILEVETPVTVTVVGTHSTGKSTFLARLAHELRVHGIQVATVADFGEEAQRQGLPLLFNHTWASTLWIIARGISSELEAWLHADVVLVDRGVPDALGYYRAALEYRQEPHDPEIMAYLENIVRHHSRNYDLVLRTTLEVSLPLGDNKIRDTDPNFRAMADRNVDLVLRELAIPYKSLTVDGHDHALKRAVEFVYRRLT